MKIASNIFKSSVLAYIIFWLIILAFEPDEIYGLFFIFSYIPIFICVALVVGFTICPFFWVFMNEKRNTKQVFKLCFPWYSVIGFSICFYQVHQFEYYFFALAFFTSAFLTTCQSWLWFALEKSKSEINTKILTKNDTETTA